MSTLKEFNFKNKKALIRVDFNVPLDENLQVTDDTRIQSAKNTIFKVLEDGGSCVLMSHLGRPKSNEPEFSLKNIAPVVEDILGVQVLFANFGSDESLYSYKAIQSLRSNGIIAELYPEASKLKKQITYANKRNIPFVVLVGDEEMFSKRFTVKDMKSGTQESLNLQELLACLKTKTQ